MSKQIKSVIKECWNEEPAKRPKVAEIKRQIIRALNLSGQLREPMISQILGRLEIHSQALEDEVEARTLELLAERRKCDDLLSEMLPR